MNKMHFKISGISVFIIVILIFGGFLLEGCEDYKLFDTTPSFVIGNPKIRFVNLHFSKKNLKLNIGDGRLVKENLVHRELTAYEEAPDFLKVKTPFTVTDVEGVVLLQDSLFVEDGNNYTFYISPVYNTIVSDYQITGSETQRLMASLRTDKVGYAFLADPISAPLADRATARQVSFTPIIVARPNFFFIESIRNLPYFINSKGDKILFIKDQTKQPDYAFGPSFINFGYQVTSPGSYTFAWGVDTTATSVTTSVQAERVFNLKVAKPHNLQAGKSYTILSNGTVGNSNDLIFPSDVRGPIALNPIPYEAFIIDDLDASARTLVPVALDRVGQQVAIINFIDLNYTWKAANPATQLQLSIRGVVPPKGRLFDDAGFRLIGLPGNVVSETKQFGNQIIEPLPVGLSRPVLATGEANLKPNGKYFAFHYIDQSGAAKLKVVEADTVVNFNSVIRVNFANFSPNLGPIEVINAETNQVLITEVKFTELSASLELAVDRSFIGNLAFEKVAKLKVIRPSTKEVLFEIDLAPSSAGGNSNLLLGGGQRNSGLVYTVIFSGRYSATSGPDKFEKRLFCLERADKPTNSGENIFDWRLSYGLFP